MSYIRCVWNIGCSLFEHLFDLLYTYIEWCGIFLFCNCSSAHCASAHFNLLNTNNWACRYDTRQLYCKRIYTLSDCAWTEYSTQNQIVLYVCWFLFHFCRPTDSGLWHAVPPGVKRKHLQHLQHYLQIFNCHPRHNDHGHTNALLQPTAELCVESWFIFKLHVTDGVYSKNETESSESETEWLNLTILIEIELAPLDSLKWRN